MALTTAESLFSVLGKSKLLTPDQLSSIRRDVFAHGPLDVKACARELVRRKLVTRWQAQRLLAGRFDFHLGQYKLVSRIAEGGMGSIFMAYQTALNRPVAIKVMAQKLVDNPESVARFRREAKMAAALKHPNVVAAFDADQVGDVYFLVMEYVNGRDLNDWITEYGKLPIDWSCECIRQAALGLQYAHEQGLVHRDIKPSNVLVAEDPAGGPPVVKILDLGLARMQSDLMADESELTQTGQIMGTPDYIAPEQAKNTKTADIRADIFSLGCTLFKMLTGKVPFAGDNAMEKLAARFSGDAPLASSLRDEIPTRLDLVLARMLARDPDRRFQTPVEVAQALAPFSAAAEGKWDEDSALNLPMSPDEKLGLEPEADAGMRQYFGQVAMNETMSAVHNARRMRVRILSYMLILSLICMGSYLKWRPEIDASARTHWPKVQAWWQSLQPQTDRVPRRPTTETLDPKALDRGEGHLPPR